MATLNRAMIVLAVKSVYPNKKWAKKVDKMTDRQLFAIVMYFRKKGLL